MTVYAFEPFGYEGELVTVEVDLRRGIPSVDLVGLADGAIREARERIRAAIRNSGYEFPLDRLLISLAPAGVKKAGASFDLAMALAVLSASGQVADPGIAVMALGELELSGRVRPVGGVLPAVAAGRRAGVSAFVVPRRNLSEARVLAGDGALPIDSLSDCVDLAIALRSGLSDAVAYADRLARRPGTFAAFGSPRDDSPGGGSPRRAPSGSCPPPGRGAGSNGLIAETEDMADLRGQLKLRRAMEAAAAGHHHMLLFGPPGAGKSMAARRLPGLLPDLDEEDAVTATALHSLAGALPESSGLLRRPPFRAPHHGASAEGIVGGGRLRKPGEISLAHAGVLLLDEAPEFRSDVLQALREPIEDGRITIARADRSVEYPSRFILVLSCNPCPCGSMGRRGSVCLCTADEVRRYWKRLGGPLLDRVDIRVPVEPTVPDELAQGPGESSASIRARVSTARRRQAARLDGTGYRYNGLIPAGSVSRFCEIDAALQRYFSGVAERDGLSARACHSVLRVARTLADLASDDTIGKDHLDEALGMRKYGGGDLFWISP